MSSSPAQYEAVLEYVCNDCGHKDAAPVTIEQGTAAVWSDEPCSVCESVELEWGVEVDE